MNLLLPALFAACASVSASAANPQPIDNYETSVGAQAILRQVLEKKLIGKTNASVNADIKRALEGSGESTTHDTITKMACDRALGSDFCVFSFFGELNDGKGEEPEYSFDIRVGLYQGKVMSATVENYAG